MLLLLFAHVAFSLLAFSGCLLNAFLIYLVINKTPNVIKVYITLVFNFAITDFLVCSIEYFIQLRLIPAGRSVAYVAQGPCSYFGPWVCYIGYSMSLHLFAHSLWSLLLSFGYRYYILFYPAPTRKTLIIILFIFYIPSTIQWISFLFAYDDPKIIESILRKRYPAYDLDDVTITGNIDMLSFRALSTILYMTLPISPVYTAILWLRRKIIMTLTKQSSSMSKETKCMHNQLLKALTYQAILPGFFLFAVVAYSLGQFGIINHPFLESSTFVSVLFIPVLSPIGSFLFIKPYRTFIVSMFSRKSNYIVKKTPVFASTSH